MTLLVKFKTGKLQKYENVDDTELDDDYLYVYMCNGKILRCHSSAVKYYVERYESTGQEFCTYPDKGRGYY